MVAPHAQKTRTKTRAGLTIDFASYRGRYQGTRLDDVRTDSRSQAHTSAGRLLTIRRVRGPDYWIPSQPAQTKEITTRARASATSRWRSASTRARSSFSGASSPAVRTKLWDRCRAARRTSELGHRARAAGDRRPRARSALARGVTAVVALARGSAPSGADQACHSRCRPNHAPRGPAAPRRAQGPGVAAVGADRTTRSRPCSFSPSSRP